MYAIGNGVEIEHSINLLAYSKERFALLGLIYLQTKLFIALGFLKDFTFSLRPSKLNDLIVLRSPIVTASPEVSKSSISASSCNFKYLYFGWQIMIAYDL